MFQYVIQLMFVFVLGVAIASVDKVDDGSHALSSTLIEGGANCGPEYAMESVLDGMVKAAKKGKSEAVALYRKRFALHQIHSLIRNEENMKFGTHEEFERWANTIHRMNVLVDELFNMDTSGAASDDNGYLMLGSICDERIYGMEPLATTFYSVVFANGSTVTKFTTNCSQTAKNKELVKNVDPLLEEFMIMKILEDLNIAPKARQLSSLGVPSVDDWTRDVRFRPNALQKEGRPAACESVHASVRAIVEDRVGITVSQYIRKKFPRPIPNQSRKFYITKMIAVITIAISSLDLLKILHAAGFLHGDIHFKNVSLREDNLADDLTDNLVLIDFGYSVFFPVDIGTSEKGVLSRRLSYTLLSPWHLLQFRIGRRCDVFRTLEIIPRLMFPTFAEELSGLGDRAKQDPAALQELIEYKQKGQYFEIFCTLLPESDAVNCKSVVGSLNKALELARSVEHVDSRPPYEEIVHFLGEAKEQLLNMIQ